MVVKKQSKFLKFTIFLAVFFSSIIGLSFFGISANALFALPLLLYLIIDAIKDGTMQMYISKVASNLIIWYLIVIISSLYGLYYIDVNKKKLLDDAVATNIIFIVQIIFVYIPMIILLLNSKKKLEISQMIKKSILLTAKINVLWVFLQFIFENTNNFDLNNWLFVKVLGQGSDWTSYSNLMNQGVLLRPTGLNRDSAFLAIILLFGFVFDENKFMRAFYFFAIIISFSRSGLFAFLAVIAYFFLYDLMDGKIQGKKLINVIFTFVMSILVFYIAYKNILVIQNQVDRMLQRLSTISTGSDGTSLHMMYPLSALVVVSKYFPIGAMSFGIGPKISGVAFSIFSSKLKLPMRLYMLNNVWAIECDFATVILGSGIIGAVVYYILWYRLYKNGNKLEKAYVFAMVIMGLMYNYCSLIFILYVILYLIVSEDKLLDYKGE